MAVKKYQNPNPAIDIDGSRAYGENQPPISGASIALNGSTATPPQLSLVSVHKALPFSAILLADWNICLKVVNT